MGERAAMGKEEPRERKQPYEEVSYGEIATMGRENKNGERTTMDG